MVAGEEEVVPGKMVRMAHQGEGDEAEIAAVGEGMEAVAGERGSREEARARLL